MIKRKMIVIITSIITLLVIGISLFFIIINKGDELVFDSFDNNSKINLGYQDVRKVNTQSKI